MGRLVELTVLALVSITAVYAANDLSTDGKSFVVVWPVTKNDTRDGRSQLYVTTKEERATITVEYSATNVQNYVIGPFNPLRTGLGPGRRTIDGLENNKAVYVTSDFDVSVLILTEDVEAFGDSALVQPVRADSVDFIMNAPHDNRVGDCGTVEDRTFSFIVVVAEQDGTEFTITNSLGEEVLTETLDRFQAYTYRQVYAQRNVGVDGYRVTSSGPINVVDGNACFVGGLGIIGSPVFDYAPPLTRLGMTHITPPVSSDSNQQDKIIKIVAAERGVPTIVRLTNVADQIVLEPGQTRRAQYNAFNPSVVICDYPCSVTMTTWNQGPSYMTHVTPTSQYSSNLLYTFPNINRVDQFQRSMHIMTESANVASIFFNGNSLGNLDWDCSLDALTPYCVTEFDMNRGTWQLRSTDPEVTFGAIVQARFVDPDSNLQGKGYGYHIGFFGEYPDVPPAPNPNTTSRVQPVFDVLHTASFLPVEEETIPEECEGEYQLVFTAKAKDMENMVNSRIREGLLCEVPYVFGPVGLLNTTSIDLSAFVNFTGGTTDLGWKIQGAAALSISQVESCGADVSAFLAPYENWGDYVIPPVEGCPNVSFVGDAFTSEGELWNCNEQILKDGDIPSLRTDELRLELTLTGEFSTTNNAPINTTCAKEYSLSFDDSSLQVTADVNNLLADGGICAGRLVPMLTTFSNVNYQGSQGVTTHSVVFNPGSTISFFDIETCLDEISAYMEDQANWPLPIIPRPGTCPNVRFDPNSFGETSREWLCDTLEQVAETRKGTTRMHRLPTRTPKEKLVFHQPKAFLDRLNSQKTPHKKASHKKMSHSAHGEKETHGFGIKSAKKSKAHKK